MIQYEILPVELVLYMIGFALLLASLAPKYRPMRRVGFWFVLSGYFLSSLGLIEWGVVGKHVPWSNFYETLLMVSWLLVGGSFLAAWRFRTALLFLGTLPVAGAMVLFAMMLPPVYSELTPLAPTLRSHWLLVHVPLVLASYAAFIIAAGASAMYLIKERSRGSTEFLPPLETLDMLNYAGVALGVVMMISGVIMGAIWAMRTWGTYWQWDAKESAAFITIIIYVIALHLRHFRDWKGSRLAWLSLAGFLMVIFTHIASNFLTSGLHSYAK